MDNVTLALPRNLRDLGGAPTKSGQRVRAGVLYRSGSLHQVGRDVASAFVSTVGARTLVDLRSPDEAADLAVDLALFEADYVNVPFFARTVGHQVQQADVPSTLLEAYLAIADHSAPAIAEVFSVLASPDALPAVVFCAAGKDRTGVASALVLGALNVEDPWIVDDYARTGTVDPHTLGDGYAERMSYLADEFRTAPPQTMTAFLDALRSEHGSVRAYLAKAGVSISQLCALESALLEDA